MEKTQKLLSIALTVLALDGWGAASAAEAGRSRPRHPRRASSSLVAHSTWHSGFHHSHHSSAMIHGGTGRCRGRCGGAREGRWHARPGRRRTRLRWGGGARRRRLRSGGGRVLGALRRPSLRVARSHRARCRGRGRDSCAARDAWAVYARVAPLLPRCPTKDWTRWESPRRRTTWCGCTTREPARRWWRGSTSCARGMRIASSS